MSNQNYNAKILLFGEYTIINGSHGLAMPITQFSGKWVVGRGRQTNLFQGRLCKRRLNMHCLFQF